MKTHTLFFAILLNFFFAVVQSPAQEYRKISAEVDSLVLEQYRQVAPFFDEAYCLYPSVPRGILEAVAYTYTRFTHRKPDLSADPPEQMPATYGVMGLTWDGKGFFRENLKTVSLLSGYSVSRIMDSPRDNIVAYAAAYSALQQQYAIETSEISAQFPILTALSELPLLDTPGQRFAMQSQRYALCRFLDDSLFRKEMRVNTPPVDYERCFGEDLKLLRSPVVDLSQWREDTDYAGAVWIPAGTCNYSSRNGHAISAITIHYTSGTYAGSISWFQNCTYNGVGAQASAHYVLRSSDGQVAQMVREADKAWHVGNANPYTVGIEHEAYGDVASYFTPTMYQSSADLTRDICNRNGISPLRMFYRDTLDNGTVLNSGLHDLGGETACTKIRGHQHFPNQTHTDPGPFWNWNYYYKLVNDDTPVTEHHAPDGILTDSGGENGNYGDDERQLVLIQVEDAESILLDFSQFELEENYDFMWIYDGNTVFSPLIGRWNTHSPGQVSSSGNALLVEFRSDCATNAAGWVAQWHAIIPSQDNPPVTHIDFDESQWITEDFTLHFTDEDDHGLADCFYQVMGYDGEQWTACHRAGFACDNFDIFNTSLWQVQSGRWSVTSGHLVQSGSEPATLSMPLNGNLSDAYLYDFRAGVMSTGGSGSGVEFTFSCDNNRFGTSETAYTLTILPADRCIRLYRIAQGERIGVESSGTLFFTTGVTYGYRVLHRRITGEVIVFRDGEQVLRWQDPDPLTLAGNYLALGTKGVQAEFDNFRVYRSRHDMVAVTTGLRRDSELPWQAVGGVPKAKVKSIVMDDVAHFSGMVEEMVKTDFSAPVLQGAVTLTGGSAREQRVSWPQASDPHSGVTGYEYALVPAGVQGNCVWKSTQRNSATFPNNILTDRQYQVRVRARNGAGLYSREIVSPPFDFNTGRPEAIAKERALSIVVSPNPTHEHFLLMVAEEQEEMGEINTPSEMDVLTRIYDVYGRLMLEQKMDDGMLEVDVRKWSDGLYLIQVMVDGHQVAFKKFIRK
ncbi:MAG: N-acetylmuramoyl-L-alanine amidase [Bacteroidales bacterium]|nr:N-acetylmuramoyl-L-alanine amidase [Bacteroidales bacterium]